MKNLLIRLTGIICLSLFVINSEGAAMSGTYSIGPTGTYASFAAAVAALNAGYVVGPVIFNVQPKTYNERVVLTNVYGTSVINTITFKGTYKSSVILNYSSTSLQSTLVFNGAKYISFEDMTIQNMGTIGRAVFFTNLSENNSLSNCIINVNTASNSNSIIAVEAGSNEATWASAGNNANYTTIKNCDINGGFYGILMYGSNSTTLCTDNQILTNTFSNQYNYSVYMQYQRRDLLQRNNIDIGYRLSTATGICQKYCEFSNIDGNLIKPGQYGIYTYYEDTWNFTDSSYFYNNMILGFKNVTSQAGIFCYSFNDNIFMYHNSIRVDGTTVNDYHNAAIVCENPFNLTIRNNILSTYGGSMLLGIYDSYGNPANIEYNAYWAPVTFSNLYCNYGTYYKKLSDWKKSSRGLYSKHDKNSIDSLNPNFISQSDLHLNISYLPLKAIPVGITHDFDGDIRCPFEAIIGADEIIIAGPKPNGSFTYDDSTCFPANITFRNTASANDPISHDWYLDNVYKTSDLHYTESFFSRGIFSVKLITTNCYGSDTFSRTIVVDTPKVAPVSDLISSVNKTKLMEDVTLYDMTSGCPVKWKWTISPAGTVNPTYTFKAGSSDSSQNPVVQFEYAGKYSVCLLAADIKGRSNQLCKTNYIEVEAPAVMCVWPFVSYEMTGIMHDDVEGPGYIGPVIKSSCSYYVNTCADTVIFTFSAFDVKAGDYFMIYDDSTTAKKPLWNYLLYPNGLGNGMIMASPGYQGTFISLTGKLYVKWNRTNHTTAVTYTTAGFTGTWSGHKRLNLPATVAKFSCPDTICLGTNVVFTNLSKGMNMSYEWTCAAAGILSANKNLSFTFTAPARYKVFLKASGCGGDSTFYKYIVVLQPATAPFTDFYTNLTNPVRAVDVVEFIDLSKGCIDSWKWSISPSTYTVVSGFPNSAAPKIVFHALGCYDITLITGYNGHYDTLTKTCYINVIEYCTPMVQNLNVDVGISLVKIGTINNNTTIGSAQYSDYTATQSTVLGKGISYQLQVERNTTFNTMNRKVWIDYNTDGDFLDAGENVATEASASTKTWITTITIPTAIKNGATRMRIGTSLSAMSNSPCGVNYIGEFEDYRVIIAPDTIPPVIKLKGVDSLFMVQCVTYIDSGATAISSRATSLTSKIVVTNNLNPTKSGTYQYFYNVTDSIGNKAHEVVRTIIVLPESNGPVIKLRGVADTTIEVLSVWTDPGIIATDSCSGVKSINISASVDATRIGNYLVTYKAFDYNNNMSSTTRMVHVRDTVSPLITLNGLSIVNVPVYTKYTEYGVTANDNFDPNPVITYSGHVDTAVVGKYILNYNVRDHFGNGPVSIYRTVNVVDTTAPKVTASGYKDTLVLPVFSILTEPVFTVTDNYYKTFVKTVSGSFHTLFPTGKGTIVGFYPLIYSFTDSSGNTGSKTFIVNVADQIKPVVTLIGPMAVNLCRYMVLKATDDKVTISDNYDKNPTLNRSGNYVTDYLVNKAAGYYTLVYTAIDSSGNVSDPVNRMVNVEDCPQNSLEENSKLSIGIYPNPAADHIDIFVQSPENNNYQLSIVNFLGEEVVAAFNICSNKIVSLNLLKLNPGIYLVKIQSGAEIHIKKVTIAR